MLAELRREIAAGEPVVDRRATVGTLLLAWLADAKGRVSGASWIRYESLIRLQLAGLRHIPVVGLTPEHIRAHIRALEASPSAVRAALRVLRSALAVAVNDGTLVRNPAIGVPVPRRPTSVGRALTDDETECLVAAAADDPLRALWLVYVDAGLRMGEALALRWPDIDVADRSLTVTGSLRHQDARCRAGGPRLARQEPKTAAGRRWVPLTARAALAVDALPRDAVWVFHRGHGRPLNPSTVQRAFAALVEKAELPPMRLHDVRHTWVTRMLANGASLHEVRLAAGHSSIAITSDTYGHLVKSRLRDVTERLETAAS